MGGLLGATGWLMILGGGDVRDLRHIRGLRLPPRARGLASAGLVVNHKKNRRLMREHALQPRIRRRFVATTDSDHDGPIFPNLAKDLVPIGPNQLWVCDINYVARPAGSLRLRRHHSRRLVAPDRRLRHRTLDRHAPDGGGLEGGNRPETCDRRPLGARAFIIILSQSANGGSTRVMPHEVTHGVPVAQPATIALQTVHLSRCAPSYPFRG
jgi:hypothetical protein